MAAPEGAEGAARHLMREGALYEGVLSCESFAAPVGLVRRGGSIEVRLFRGRTRQALLEAGVGAVHLTDDPLVLLIALEGALPVDLGGPVPRARGCFASIAVEVAGRSDRRVRDELGEADVAVLSLRPTLAVVEGGPPRPLCRGDGQLVEALVHATRAREGSPDARKRAEEALSLVERALPDGAELGRRVRSLMGGGR